MTPEQLKNLQKLSQTFSQGNASSQEISQLSQLLSVINLYNSGRTNFEQNINKAYFNYTISHHNENKYK